jgi:hypothetical protein
LEYQVLNAGNELIDNISSQGVELNHIKHGLSPFALLKLIDMLLGGLVDSLEFQSEGSCKQ